MNERASNPAPDSRNHTIASIIDLYLTHSKRSYAARSFATRQHVNGGLKGQRLGG
jgi:hypothetical protein